MIELVNVCKRFNEGTPSEFTAIDSVTLTFERGKVTVLKGPSGSGKTTLLSLTGCMSRPTSGRIMLRGVRLPRSLAGAEATGIDISSLPERFLTMIRRQTFGFIFQQLNLVKGISVRENILLPLYPTGQGHAVSRRRSTELLERFRLARHATSPLEWLSGGELQRVAIARALVNDPAVVVADEPTAHLDSCLSGEFMSTVGDLRAAGTTVLIASHDPLVCGSKLADRVVEMRDGRILDAGP